MSATCCKSMPRGFGFGRVYRPCGKPSKVEVEGKHYCGVHNPIKRDERRAARNAEWNARMERERKRNLLESAAPELRDALAELVRFLEPLERDGCLHVYAPGLATLNRYRAVLAKVTP